MKQFLKDKWAMIVTVLVVFAVVTTMAILAGQWSDRRQADANKQREFAGACKVLNGEVHDDLCIKDNAVVLDRAEFDKEK